MKLERIVSDYINRYAPSEKKLREYLSRKNHTLDTSLFLKEIGYDERLMSELWLRTFVSQGISEKKIREKLTRKQFPQVLIEEKIGTYTQELRDWDSHKSSLDSRIQEYLRKGKSKKYIDITLVSLYPYFRRELRELLDKKDDTCMLHEQILKYSQKYDISDFSQKQKLYGALMRKGFDFEDIRSLLKIQEEE